MPVSVDLELNTDAIDMILRTLVASSAILSAWVVGGCEELPSDPTPSQQIVGEWKASKIGQVFAAAVDLDVNFKTSGDLTMIIDGLPYNGTYATTGSSIVGDIREIAMSVSGVGSMVGIYSISGSQMRLEVVPDPVTPGIGAPTPAGGIGSTTVGGVRTNAYVTEMQRK